MKKRIGIIAILGENKQSVPKTNAILSSHAEIIIGRMGVPKEKQVNVISIIVDGTTDEIVPFPEIGNLPGVTAKTVLASPH